MLATLRSARDYLRQRFVRFAGALMSLNDPQWGRRPGGGGGGGGNQGPPDLEELWRNFNRRLEGLFGRRGGGGDPQGPTASGPRRMGGIGLLALLVVVIWLFSGFYIVPEGQRGVVLRFGKFVDPPTMPGPRWHLPYPIESAEVVNLSGVRTVEVGYRNNVKSKVLKESLMLTDDENIIDVQFAVQYVLKSPIEYLFNSRDPDESVLQAARRRSGEGWGRGGWNLCSKEGRRE